MTAAERAKRYRQRARAQREAAPQPETSPDGATGERLDRLTAEALSALESVLRNPGASDAVRVSAARGWLPFGLGRLGIRPVPVDGRKHPDVRILTVPDPADRRDREAALAELGLLTEALTTRGVDVPAVLAELKGGVDVERTGPGGRSDAGVVRFPSRDGA